MRAPDAATRVPGAGDQYDAEVIGNRHRLVVIENRDGASAITLRDPGSGAPTAPVPTNEVGVVSSHAIAYGKRYASLDDTTKRLDSVTVHGALNDLGLDQDRAALWGGS